jgi:hypothetical protein
MTWRSGPPSAHRELLPIAAHLFGCTRQRLAGTQHVVPSPGTFFSFSKVNIMRLQRHLISIGLLSASLLVAGIASADVPEGGAGGAPAEGGAPAGGAPAEGGSPPAGGSPSAGGEAAGGGGSDEGDDADDGCTVANAGAPLAAGTMSALAFVGLAFAGGARRRAKKK